MNKNCTLYVDAYVARACCLIGSYIDFKNHFFVFAPSLETTNKMGPNTRASSIAPNRRRSTSVGTNRGRISNPPRLGINSNPVPQQTAQWSDDNPTDEARELRALYDKHMEDMGVTHCKDTERYVLRNYVYDTIWTLKKFVAGDHEMEATGCIATLVFEGVNVNTLDRPEYWKRNRSYVVDCINLKRSNTSGSIKREFISK
jgi:hypothetical protein